jgi:hypothetical protein
MLCDFVSMYCLCAFLYLNGLLIVMLPDLILETFSEMHNFYLYLLCVFPCAYMRAIVLWRNTQTHDSMMYL